MFLVDNKFKVGEECYTVYKKPIHYKCPICEGNGKFQHNGYDVWCKKCNGSGKIHDSRQFVLAVCKVKVRRIDVGIGNDEDMNIKYRLNSVDKNIKVNRRNENNLFKTYEEANEHCISAITKGIAENC